MMQLYGLPKGIEIILFNVQGSAFSSGVKRCPMQRYEDLRLERMQWIRRDMQCKRHQIFEHPTLGNSYALR